MRRFFLTEPRKGQKERFPPIAAIQQIINGARAYFDGDYCKVTNLDEKQKAGVIKSAEAGALEEQ